MSTESHNSAHNAGALPEHDTVAFENRDVKPRTIYVYLAVLALSVVLSYVVCVFILRITTKMAAESDTPPPPSLQEKKKFLTTLPYTRLIRVSCPRPRPPYHFLPEMPGRSISTQKHG